MATKLSVLVTFYNQEKFVRDCLDSIIEQEFKETLEILIGDDGSCDSTVEILEKYKTMHPGLIEVTVMPREKAVIYNAIERASLNRLNLLSKAKGDYVCFLDGDDYYSDKLFFRDAIAKLEADKTLAACAFQYSRLDKNVITDIESNLNYGAIDVDNYLKTTFIHVGAFIFRNSTDFKTLNYFKSISIFDDNVITIYHISRGRIFQIKRHTYVYRQSTDSIWNKSGALEKNIINSLAYFSLSPVLKKHRRAFILRCFGPIEWLHSNRFELTRVDTGSVIDKYLKLSKKSQFTLLEALLDWNNASVINKSIIKSLLFYFFLLRLPGRIFRRLKKIIDGQRKRLAPRA